MAAEGEVDVGFAHHDLFKVGWVVRQENLETVGIGTIHGLAQVALLEETTAPIVHTQEFKRLFAMRAHHMLIFQQLEAHLPVNLLQSFDASGLFLLGERSVVVVVVVAKHRVFAVLGLQTTQYLNEGLSLIGQFVDHIAGEQDVIRT